MSPRSFGKLALYTNYHGRWEHRNFGSRKTSRSTCGRIPRKSSGLSGTRNRSFCKTHSWSVWQNIGRVRKAERVKARQKSRLFGASWYECEQQAPSCLGFQGERGRRAYPSFLEKLRNKEEGGTTQLQKEAEIFNLFVHFGGEGKAGLWPMSPEKIKATGRRDPFLMV